MDVADEQVSEMDPVGKADHSKTVLQRKEMQGVTLLGDAMDGADRSSQRKRKLETVVYSPPKLFSDQQEMDLVENTNIHPYKICTGRGDCDDADDYGFPNDEEFPIPCTPAVTLFGKFGLHSYNSYKGTNLEFKSVTESGAVMVSLLSYYLTLEARDPHNNSPVAIETCVWHASSKSKEKLRLVTVSCCIKDQSEEVCSLWDQNGVNELYTGVMPKWLDDGALTGSEKLQYYEVKESELQENDEWLNLYAQVVAYSEWDIGMVDHFPLKIEKVVVQTKEDFVEPSVNKLKSRNAIFYISFKTFGGLKCRGIIRKTTDGGPQHICLEVDCEIDK